MTGIRRQLCKYPATASLGSECRRGACARRGFTLIELLIVVTLLGILASVVLPSVNSSGGVGLEAAARVLASDLRLARSLAIQHNTDWTVTFDPRNNTYELEHTGTGNVPLPVNPLAPPGEGNRYVVDLNRWSDATRGGQSVRLRGLRLSESETAVADVTFGPLGGTGPVRIEDTQLWLSQGVDDQQRFLVVRISWVTGQVWIEVPDSNQIPTNWNRLMTEAIPI